jgi:hypothetical protein
MFQRAHHLVAIALAISFTGSVASAAPRESESTELVASLEIHPGNIAGIRLEQEQGRNLLYLQDSYNQSITVVDVTQATHPKIVGELPSSVDVSAAEKIGSISVTDNCGLTYVVDQDGLTILRKQITSAAEIEREFEKRLLYDR